MIDAVTVDYYPPPDHSPHVKYVQPTVKYIQQPEHVKYIQQPEHVKYIQQPQQIVKYIDKPHYEKHHHDYDDEPAQYEYGYTVHDDHSGDYKSHTEKRDGDTVHGRYEVLDPDGFKRIVEYTADAHHGFNAVVHREPTDVKVPVKVVKKIYEPQATAVKYYSEPHHEQHIAQPKYYSPLPVQQKIIVPSPTPPQYYAAPERPKYYRSPKIVKQIYPEPHTSIKYVTPNHHYSPHSY